MRGKMNDVRSGGVHPSVSHRFAFLPLVVLMGCGASVYSSRPHRFDSPGNVAQETHRVAQRMSQRGVARLFADPARGTIVTPWRLSGSTASITLWPPGERHGWQVVRHRVLVRPNGWGSSVFVEVEKFDCRAGAFTWTETELHGDCRRVDEMTESELQELDRYGASLRG